MFYPLLIWTLLPNLTFYLIVWGFHRTFATGATCQQRTLTPPDTWSCPTLGLACVLMLRPISPEHVIFFPDFWVSNITRYYSFALSNMKSPFHYCLMTFWPPISYTDFLTDQTFQRFHDLGIVLHLHWITSGFHGAFATAVAFQQGIPTLPDTLVRPLLGLAYTAIVETRYPKLAMSFLDMTSSWEIGLNISTRASTKWDMTRCPKE